MIGLDLIGQALGLQRAPFEIMLREAGGLRLALGVVFLAGLSQTLGQSFVLFVNGVSRRRFAVSLVVSAALYMFGFFFLFYSIWLVAKYGFGRDQSFIPVLRAVGLAHAPFLFSFFILTPYLGSFFGAALSLWNLSAILVALSVTLSLDLPGALLCSALGWLLLQVAARTVGRPIQALADGVRRVAAGQVVERNRQRLYDLIRRGRK